eukprot:TRINITY_DN7158_c0_g1_i31.p1 TRINITY_DN7158_c0_g1~~TRINITY_DN7158_c0_g1_i31.p1  ORF type:complete len:187 (-),score=8.06 TRINITY_DN7158_c0_g1_i31:213-773(-)
MTDLVGLDLRYKNSDFPDMSSYCIKILHIVELHEEKFFALVPELKKPSVDANSNASSKSNKGLIASIKNFLFNLWSSKSEPREDEPPETKAIKYLKVNSRECLSNYIIDFLGNNTRKPAGTPCEACIQPLGQLTHFCNCEEKHNICSECYHQRMSTAIAENWIEISRYGAKTLCFVCRLNLGMLCG